MYILLFVLSLYVFTHHLQDKSQVLAHGNYTTKYDLKSLCDGCTKTHKFHELVVLIAEMCCFSETLSMTKLTILRSVYEIMCSGIVICLMCITF